MKDSLSHDSDYIALKEAMDQLSSREILVVLGILEGKTRKQAMLDAGYSKSMAETQQRRVVGRERVRKAFFALLDSQGSIMERVAKVVKEGLEANHIVISEDGTDIRIDPDHATRYKYLVTVLKILGLLSEKPVPQPTNTYEEQLRKLAEQ